MTISRFPTSLFVSLLTLAIVPACDERADPPSQSQESGDRADGDKGDKGDKKESAQERLNKGEELPVRPETNESTGPQEVHPAIEMGATGVKATCTTQGWTESEVRELTDVVGVNLDTSKIYPGALLQGAYMQKGQLVPVTIPRAPGTIYVSGLTLDKDARYAAKGAEIGGAAVQETLQRLLTDNEVQGTTARSSFHEDSVYDKKSFLFKAGIDARVSGVVNVAASLNVGKNTGKTYVFSKFTQVYYDAVFEDPEVATSVFEGGAEFKDPEGQIARNNPPLYVSKVSYGRMIFFVAESMHDGLEVKAALSAAVRGGPADVKLESGLSYAQVLERANIYYYVVGGAADLALAPIKAADPSKMFQAIKNFIADRESANFSAKNPGAPIAYTLRYLKDRTIAKMSYTVSYDKKHCDYDYPALEPDTKVHEIPNPDEIVVIPVQRIGKADANFLARGPEMEVKGRYFIEDGRLNFELKVNAKEVGGDGTHFRGSQKRVVYVPPKGWKVAEIRSEKAQTYRYIDKDTKEDKADFGGANLFSSLRMIGNSLGDDLGKTKVTARLNPVVIAIRPE